MLALFSHFIRWLRFFRVRAPNFLPENIDRLVQQLLGYTQTVGTNDNHSHQSEQQDGWFGFTWDCFYNPSPQVIAFSQKLTHVRWKLHMVLMHNDHDDSARARRQGPFVLDRSEKRQNKRERIAA